MSSIGWLERELCLVKDGSEVYDICDRRYAW